MATCACSDLWWIAGRDAVETVTPEEAAFGHSVVIHSMYGALVLLDVEVKGSFAEQMKRRRLG